MAEEKIGHLIKLPLDATNESVKAEPVSYTHLCPPWWQPHFRSNADRAYNTLHFACLLYTSRCV